MAHPDIVSTGEGGGRNSGEGRINLDIDSDAGNPDIDGNGHHGLEVEDNQDQGDFEDPQSNLDLEDEEGGEEEPQGDEGLEGEDEDDPYAGLDDEGDESGLETAGEFTIELGNGKSFDLSKVKDLPADVRREIARGHMRQKDYTEKTQQLAQDMAQWGETVTGATQIWENFQVTKHRPDNLLQWFSPQELLMAVASAGLEVDPSLLPVGWRPGLPNHAAQGQYGHQQNYGQPRVPQGQAQPNQQNNTNFEVEKLKIQNTIQQHLNDGLSGIKDKGIRASVRDMALNIMATQQNFNPAAAIKLAKARMRNMLGSVRGQKKQMQKKGRSGRGTGGSNLLVGQGGKRPTSWDAADIQADSRVRSLNR